MTKPVSLSIDQLIEQGRLGLDSGEQYLPELPSEVFESFEARPDLRAAAPIETADRPHFLTPHVRIAYPFTSASGAIFKPRDGNTSVRRTAAFVRSSAGTKTAQHRWSASWSRVCPAKS